MSRAFRTGSDLERVPWTDVAPRSNRSWIRSGQNSMLRALVIAVALTGEILLYALLKNATGDALVGAILALVPVLPIASWAVNRPGRRR